MMKRIVLLTVTLLLMGVSANAKTQWREKYETKKVKIFEVGDMPKLNITNKYGMIKIVEGRNNQVKVTIDIKLSAQNEDILESLKKGIDFRFASTNSSVTMETELNIVDIGRNIFGSQRYSLQIDYLVEAPRKYIANFEIKYGNIYMQDSYGDAKFVLKYGDLYAGEFLGENCDINVGYGNIEIESCDNVEIVAKYSNIEIEKVRELELESKYGDLELGEVNKVALSEFRYGNISIEKLANSFECNDLDYSKLVIKCGKSAQNIGVASSYTPITLYLPEDMRFGGSISTHYGSFKAPEESEVMMKNVDSGYNDFSADIQTPKFTNEDLKLDLSTRYDKIIIKTL